MLEMVLCGHSFAEAAKEEPQAVLEMRCCHSDTDRTRHRPALS